MRLLIDGNHMASRARFGSDMPLATSTGRQSGTAYVFLRSLNWLMNETKANHWHISVIWDGGRSPYRKQLYPEYKLRAPSPPETAEQDKIDHEAYIDQIACLHRDFLPALGIQSIKFPKCEADDVMSAYACQIANQGVHQVYLHTGDRDFNQLVCDSMYQIDGKGKVTTKFDVKKKWGVEGQDVVLVRAMIGDDSDNIKGVPGIGEKRAFTLAPHIRAILSGEVDLLKLDIEPKNIKWAKVAYDNREIIERNRKLMELPRSFSHPALPLEEFSLFERDRMFEQLHQRPQRDIAKFFSVCREWEFDLSNELLCSL